MDVVARLRAEREAIVARLSQIDKMLRQYDEWGREAQRLLSMTPTPQATTQESAGHSRDPFPVDTSAALETREQRHSDSARFQNTGKKTPIPEFEAMVMEVLRAAKQPLDRVALYEALTARGVVIGSDTRDADLNALSARVYRMAKNPENQIISKRGQGYRLVGDCAILDSASETTAETSVFSSS